MRPKLALVPLKEKKDLYKRFNQIIQRPLLGLIYERAAQILGTFGQLRSTPNKTAEARGRRPGTC